MKIIKNKKIFIFLIIAILASATPLIFHKKTSKPLFDNSDVRFRFYVGPRRGYYYNPYYRYRYYQDDYYSRIELFVYDTNDNIIEEVYINGRTVYQRSSYSNQNPTYFTLRSGYYTISWRVRSSRFFKNKERIYSRRIRVHPYERLIPITIKGTKIYY
jgi:hypothetical protein